MTIICLVFIEIKLFNVTETCGDVRSSEGENRRILLLVSFVYILEGLCYVFINFSENGNCMNDNTVLRTKF